MIKYILASTGSTFDEIFRCINKATFIYFDNQILYIGSNKYIYYFLTTQTKYRRKAYNFVQNNYDSLFKNKLLYSKNPRMFINHIKKANKKGLYQWV